MNRPQSSIILINIARVLDITVDCLLGDIQANVNEEYVLKAKNILAECTDNERKFHHIYVIHPNNHQIHQMSYVLQGEYT